MIEHQHERELPEGVPRRTQQNWEFSALAVQLNEVTMPNCIVVHEFCQAAAFDQLTTMGETLHHGMSPVSCIVVQSAGTALVTTECPQFPASWCKVQVPRLSNNARRWAEMFVVRFKATLMRKKSKVSALASMANTLPCGTLRSEE